MRHTIPAEISARLFEGYCPSDHSPSATFEASLVEPLFKSRDKANCPSPISELSEIIEANPNHTEALTFQSGEEKILINSFANVTIGTPKISETFFN